MAVVTRLHSVVLFGATLFVALSGCSSPRDGTELIERAGGAQRLREAALAVRSYASPDAEQLVPEAAWPEAFRVLAPEVVSVDAGGAFVTMDIDQIDASGLYVAFDATVRPQDLGPDLSFQALAPGIYWYQLVMGG